MDRRPKDSWGPWGAGGSRYRGLRFKASLLGALLLLFGAGAARRIPGGMPSFPCFPLPFVSPEAE